jgi:hypothetical protein
MAKEPGLTEMATTTLRNRTMKGSAPFSKADKRAATQDQGEKMPKGHAKPNLGFGFTKQPSAKQTNNNLRMSGNKGAHCIGTRKK